MTQFMQSVRNGFFKTLEENAHIKYPEGKYTIYGTDENGKDYFEIVDEEDLGWLEDDESKKKTFTDICLFICVF